MKINISLSEEQEVEVPLTIKGSPECVNRVLTLLATIQRNGDNGHSGTVGIAWDGDGNDKIKIDCKELKSILKVNSEGINELTNYGGLVEVVGERNTFYVIRGKDTQTTRVWPKKDLLQKVDGSVVEIDPPNQ